MNPIQYMKHGSYSRTLLLSGALGFCVMLTPGAFAQNYAIDWHATDNGGGMSAAGPYAVGGTIGQADTGVMTSGNYELTGGFWSLTGEAPGSGPIPILSVERLQSGAVRVFWTRPAIGYLLEELNTINGSPPTGWTTVAPSSYQTNATHSFISIPKPTGMRLYRLHR